MELTFTKPTGKEYYEASTVVNADFNLHIEVEQGGQIAIEVATVSTGAKQVMYAERIGKVFDRDFDAIVYPKYITVKSWSPVTKAYKTEAE